MINKTFYICTFRDGRQYPVLNVTPKKYSMLYELGMYQLSRSGGVETAIDELRKVINGEVNRFELSAGDWCVVDVRKEVSVITNNFDEFEPIEFPTFELYKLLQEWHDFLLAYESNNIPGIIHPDSRESAQL